MSALAAQPVLGRGVLPAERPLSDACLAIGFYAACDDADRAIIAYLDRHAKRFEGGERALRAVVPAERLRRIAGAEPADVRRFFRSAHDSRVVEWSLVERHAGLVTITFGLYAIGPSCLRASAPPCLPEHAA